MKSVESSFLFWHYRFTENTITIDRRFLFRRTRQIEIRNAELTSKITPFYLRPFGRANLTLVLSGNVVTLHALPTSVADDYFSEQFATEDPKSEELSEYEIKLSPADILKASVMKSRQIWYLIILALLWGAVILFSSPLFPIEFTQALSDFIFRHMLVAGTLVLSIGLPYGILYLWAITGGFLKEYLRFYKYRIRRLKHAIVLEFGLFVRQEIYIPLSQIYAIDYRQSILMRLFRCGSLSVRAIGYNSLFMQNIPILPYVRSSVMRDELGELIPEMPVSEIAPDDFRRFRYYLFSLKWLIPVAFLTAAFIAGLEWIIPCLLSFLWVFGDLWLEYRSSSFDTGDSLTVLSKGGLARTVSCLYTDRIESIAVSGFFQKIGRGYGNVSVYLFHKSGRYAKVRNIPLEKLSRFGLTADDLGRRNGVK